MSLQNQKTSDAFGQYFDVLCEKTGLYANEAILRLTC